MLPDVYFLLSGNESPNSSQCVQGGSQAWEEYAMGQMQSSCLKWECKCAGFALVGGPARQDAPRAVDALKKLNVPYMVSLPLVFQTTEEWLDSQLGVHPVQVALQVGLQPSPFPLSMHGIVCACELRADWHSI